MSDLLDGFGDDAMSFGNGDIILPQKYDWVETSDLYFHKALDAIINNRNNLLILGRAGSGKSLLIKIIASMTKNTIVLSTTGLTALNLCTDDIVAHTPHSFLEIAPHEIIPDASKKHINITKGELIQKCSTLIIDEISMMNNQLFDVIIEKIKFIRQKLPRIILFGDLMQLSPVINLESDIVRKFYQDNYNGNVMFFNSNNFPNMNFKTFFLRHSYRQTDKKFEQALYDIGYNNFDDDTLDYLNQRVMSLRRYEQENPNYIQLCPTNKMVNSINEEYIKNFPGTVNKYNAIIKGKFPENMMPTDKEIPLKKGIQIMCTVNHYEQDANYRNGTVGIVKDMFSDHVVIELFDGKTTKVLKTEIVKYEIKLDPNGQIYYSPIGSFIQIDCKPMKAITSHKSQGKSLDAAYITTNGWFPEGMMYVMLSRLKTFGGLGLSRKLTKEMITYNKESFKFLEE